MRYPAPDPIALHGLPWLHFFCCTRLPLRLCLQRFYRRHACRCLLLRYYTTPARAFPFGLHHVTPHRVRLDTDLPGVYHYHAVRYCLPPFTVVLPPQFPTVCSR